STRRRSPSACRSRWRSWTTRRDASSRSGGHPARRGRHEYDTGQDPALRPGGRGPAPARAGARADAHHDREHRHRHPRLPGRAPRPRPRPAEGVEGHLHEHPHDHGLRRPLRHRLGRARGVAAQRVDPSGRAQLPLRHHDRHRRGDQGGGGRRRGSRHRQREGQQQAGRPRDRHRRPGPSVGRWLAGGEADLMATATISRAAAIAGIGATEFSKESGRSELQLACEATLDAINDAGLAPADIDGMVTFTMDSNNEIEIARSVGIPELKFFSRIHHGGGAACGTVQQAVLAVATGVAEVVVCYRAFNERSGQRFGRTDRVNPALAYDWYSPFGLVTPASWVAMFARRYMHQFGVESEHFGHVAVADRKHAATNPKAWFYEKPITLEDHQNSRWIVEPMHLL